MHQSPEIRSNTAAKNYKTINHNEAAFASSREEVFTADDYQMGNVRYRSKY